MSALPMVMVGVRRRWRLLRVLAAALAALGLLSVAIFGGETPLWAQEAESNGVGISLDDLSDYPTHLTVDGFDGGADQSHGDRGIPGRRVERQRRVGIGGCGTATQKATVTGVEEPRAQLRACTPARWARRR